MDKNVSTTQSALPVTRLAHPLAFAMFLRKVGAPMNQIFRRAGLPAYCDDANEFVPVKRAWALFDAAASIEDAAIGWHVGRFAGDKQLSAGILRKIRHAPTLYQALYACTRLLRSESPQLKLWIHEGRDNIYLCTRYPMPMHDWAGYASSQSYQLAVYIDIVRHYAGVDWQPPEIGIELAVAPTVIQMHYPQSLVITGERCGYLSVPRRCLQLPPFGGQWRDSDDSSADEWDTPDFLATTRSVMRAYLGDGYLSAQKTARLLDTSERTLYRRLAEHGIAYQTLLDELRFGAAKNLIADEDLQIGEIAAFLGFTDSANFSRMFRRIGGLSPRQYRNALNA